MVLALATISIACTLTIFASASMHSRRRLYWTKEETKAYKKFENGLKSALYAVKQPIDKPIIGKVKIHFFDSQNCAKAYTFRLYEMTYDGSKITFHFDTGLSYEAHYAEFVGSFALTNQWMRFRGKILDNTGTKVEIKGLTSTHLRFIFDDDQEHKLAELDPLLKENTRRIRERQSASWQTGKASFKNEDYLDNIERIGEQIKELLVECMKMSES